ncbi:MAG: hypothetical protein Q9226_001891 [Calogaya cf. arnoldii]
MAATEVHNQKPEELPPNIYIIGVQSTGKTTLVTALGEHFAENSAVERSTTQPHHLKEVARGVLIRHHFTANDITSSKTRALELQRLIIEAQAAAEDALQNGWYIADRSALDAVAYAKHYVGEPEAHSLREGAAWQEIEDKMRAGVVVLCEPGGEWLVDDGVRLMPRDQTEWFELHSNFQQILAECRIPYYVLSSSVSLLGQRVDCVLETWRKEVEGPLNELLMPCCSPWRFNYGG